MERLTIASIDTIQIVHLDDTFGTMELSSFVHSLNLTANGTDRKATIIALECRQVKLFDSTTLASLVKLYTITSKLNIEIIIYNIDAKIEELFYTSKLDGFFTIISRDEFRRRVNSII